MSVRPGEPVRGPEDVAFGPGGLVTLVVQDAGDGRVLMVGHADAEAIEATLATGQLHLHSRSRGRLWRKGETSGNTLTVRDLLADCDADAILAVVDAAGPTCHRDTRSCFDPDAPSDLVPAGQPQGFAWLETLWATIADRAATRPAGSYTATLLDGGVDAAGRKVVEEATELLMAAKDDAANTASGRDLDARVGSRGALAGEAADLLFHVLVLLAERGVPPSEVLSTLRARHAGGTR